MNISRILKICVLTLPFALSPLALADDKKGHGHKHDKRVAGPNGGKVLFNVEPHAELFVRKDRKLQLTFLNDKLKPTALAKQSATGVCGKRTAPTRLKFAKSGNTLVSDKPLPKGKYIPTVIQIKGSDGKKINVRINLNLIQCKTCDYLEYACTCDHEHEGE